MQELLQPLGELMTTLRDVKLADVTYLELQPYDEQTWTRDAYNDAIVSIFTRLNTAGRTLTREEITLAWLKVGWDTQLTEGKSAGECFVELRGQLVDLALALEIDEIVSAASFVWAVAHNEGRLLANSDLLKGAVIRPMAAALSKEWYPTLSAFLIGAKALTQRTMEYGPRGQTNSLYALAVMWSWIYLAESWKAENHLSELARDDFEKRCNDSVCRYLDRWIMSSQWAGIWSGSSITTIEAYAKSLTEAGKAISTIEDYEKVHQAWDDCFAKFLDNLATDATNYINTVSAPSRDRVGLYRSLFWIWHRLDTDRWATSQTQLRVGKSKAAIEVDHTVAFGLWKSKLANRADADDADLLAQVNRLGNCALLEKNFNISKSDKSLKDFLSQIHEVIQGKIRVDAWCASLSIPQPMLDPASASTAEIMEAIENRDKEIRADLIEFIRGQKVRVDVGTPLPPKTAGPTVLSQPEHTEASQAVPPLPPVPHSPTDLGESTPIVTERPLESQSENDETISEVTARTDIGGLHAAYSEDPAVRLILDHFASRQRNQRVTEIDALLDALERAGTPSEKSELIRAFRRLDALGIGRFLAGRRGHATRFEWREKSLTARNAAINGQ